MFNIIEFLENLKIALLNVNHTYYRVQTSYEPDGISRERVFCYELYHQIRLVLGDGFPYRLHGELDKSGHIDFPPDLRNIPDFLIHLPGTHDENNVIIEVKGVFNEQNIKNDLLKIHRFMSNRNIHYKFGILLIFNIGFISLQERINSDFLCNLPPDFDKQIFIVSASPIEEPKYQDVSTFRG